MMRHYFRNENDLPLRQRFERQICVFAPEIELGIVIIHFLQHRAAVVRITSNVDPAMQILGSV